MTTPPLTVSAPVPIPLDPAIKTAQIIAQIKERADAKTHCDDDLLPVLPFVTKPTTYDIIPFLIIRQRFDMLFISSSKSNTLAAAAMEDKSIKLTSRYSLRSRSPVWSSSNSTTSFELTGESRSSKYPSPPKIDKGRTGPFDSLRREKKLAQRGGKGHDALYRA